MSSSAPVGARRRAVRHLGRRRRRVGDHQRPGALAGGSGEVDGVGVGPAAGDLDPVVLELGPVRLPAVLAEVRDGAEQEGQAGRRGGRRLDDQQVLVFGLGQVLEGHRLGQALGGEVGVVDVDADVAVVDGGQPVVADRRTAPTRRRPPARCTARGCRRPAPWRRRCCRCRTPRRRAGCSAVSSSWLTIAPASPWASTVTCQAGGRLEVGEHRVVDDERIVGDQGDLPATAPPPAARRPIRTCRRWWQPADWSERAGRAARTAAGGEQQRRSRRPAAASSAIAALSVSVVL